VDLFFVLSGYLIAGQLFKQVAEEQTVHLRSFYLKRFLRIIPAYLAVLAVYFCTPAFWEREALPPLWRFLSFTQNFGLDLRSQGTFSHAWSLCIEEQFYLILPFLILGLISLKWAAKAPFLIVGLFLAGFVCRLWSWYELIAPLEGQDGFGLAWYRWMYYPTYNRLDGLLAGVSVAGLQRFYPGAAFWMCRRGNLLLLMGLAVQGIGWYLCLEPRSFAASIFGFPIIAIGYGCLVAAAVSPACMLYRFPLRVSSATAASSYAIYLSHKGLIHITQDRADWLGIPEDSTAMFALCVVVTVAGAGLLRLVVEKPFLALKDRLLQKNDEAGYVVSIGPAEERA
jgi:peptidoglycan/LPS O-acetylase OafA/YrhL